VRGDLPVVAGGPHATFYTRDVLDDPRVDCAVLGEGEFTADELSAALKARGRLADIEGLAWRDGTAVVVNRRRDHVEDPDTLPFPAWDLIGIPAYRRYDRMSRVGSGNYMGLFTSRACPHECIYCHKMFGRGFRPRSAANVMTEIRALHDEQHVRELEIIDDCFNLDVARAKNIFESIIDSGLQLRISFPNGVCGDKLDAEFLDLAKRAGVVSMSFGIETASPRLQKLLRKNVDLDLVLRNIALAHQRRILTLGFFMLGFPTETREEMLATVDFAVRSKLHAANFFAVVPFAGTELAELARRLGKPTCTDFDHTFLGEGFTNLTDLPDREVRRIRRTATRRFYASPSRIWSIVRDYPGKSQLPRLVGALIRRLQLRL